MVGQKRQFAVMSHYRTIASIYNPDLLTKQQLINSFVVRLKKFEKIMADLRSATMEKPEQPIMLVGMRGMGKTTLLRRIAYEVENDLQLGRWLLPVVFSEEEYGITTLFKFWETIAEYLARQNPAFAGLYERMDAEHRADGDRHRYELKAFELLLEALHVQGKKLLLVIDNFGDIFKRFNKQEKQRLREVMMTCSDLRIIAGSALIMQAFFRYDDPLHEFFQVERLDGLSREETEHLLLKLGEQLPDNPVKTIIEQQPQRVEALRRVTGGNPRSIVFLFEIFVNDREGTAFTDLESILDRVTPLYKHRMDDLPTQQQEILQVLALHYDGMSAREVAERTRMNSRQVSAQLRELEQAELILTIPTHNKNHLYCVRDRFFNIWFLMRMARKSDRNRVLWLVRFLECWCDPDQLSKRSDAHRKALVNTGGYDPRAAYYVSNEEYIETKGNEPDIHLYFPLALAKNQYQFLYDYFTSEKGVTLHTRERFTPVWYALMYYMQDEHPSEYLRMPPELEETVQEIIAKVEEYREAYRLEPEGAVL
jgi:DNA-binding transcriptional ArsR family regulator/nucleoside-triphosphatase THEP1